MPRIDSPPRLSPWPFLAGDAALLGAAWLIAELSPHPLPGNAVFGIAFCVLGAAAVGVVPFLADYARKQDYALDERRRALETLSQSTATAAEQAGIAAKGCEEMAETTQATLRQAEQLQQSLQKTGADLMAKLAAARSDEKKKWEKEMGEARAAELEQIDAAVAKLTTAVEEFKKVAERARVANVLPGATEAAALVPEPIHPETPSEASTVERLVPEALVPRVEPVVEPGEPGESALPANAESAAVVEAVPVAEAPAPKKRALRKPRVVEAAPSANGGNDSLAAAAPSESAAAALKTEAADEALARSAPPDVELFDKKTVSEFTQTSPEEGMTTTSMTADGATRLLVTAYIGIGNRLFIRGEGPGLSWDQGVPLQFVSIGKWRWESADATASVSYKLFKNDQTECTRLGEQSLAPGQQQEVTAAF